MLGQGVLAPLQVLDAVLGERGQPPVEVRAANLVGDQQGFAGGVRGGVPQTRLQDGHGAIEVGGDEPLALGRGEGAAHVGRAPPAHLEQRLGDRASERSREQTELFDQARPGVARLGPASFSAAAVRGQRQAGREPTGNERGKGTTEERPRRHRAHREQQGDDRQELPAVHLLQSRLTEPVPESRPHPRPNPGCLGRWSGAEAKASPAQRDGAVHQVGAEAGQQGQEQSGHRCGTP